MDAPRAARPLPARPAAPLACDIRALARAAWRTAAVLLAALWLVYSLAPLLATAPARGADPSTDFAIFLRTAAHLRDGGPLYATPDDWPNPDLNHPAVAVAFLPLAALPPATAYRCWIALATLAYAGALAAIGRAVRLPGWARLVFAALALAAPGWRAALYQGQMTGPVALGLVAAWLLARRGRWGAAGAVLGVLVALKPFCALLLILCLVRGRRRGLAGAALGALALSLAALPFVGAAGYRGWLGALGGVAWYGSAANVSLAGVMFRAWPGLPHGAALLPAALAGCAALALARRPHAARLDRDYAALSVLAVLGSPLGWIYYVPLVALAPALLPAAPGWRQRAALAACLPLALPLGGPDATTLALLALLVPLCLAPRPRSHRAPWLRPASAVWPQPIARSE